MSEHKTEVIVNARAKGFQQVQQQAGKLMDVATKAATIQAKGYSKLEGNTKAYRGEIKRLEASLRSLEKQQLATLKALGQTERTSKAYKALHEQFRNLNAEAQRLSQQRALVQRLYGPKGPGGRPLTDADMARGGFVQGLVQGGFGINLQRGPGMWRQAAGMSLGGMARGFAGAPFGGVQGVAQGLAGIPIVGGFMAGQFQNAMQFGEGAMGVQQARLGMAPFLGAGELGPNVAAARARGRARVRPEQFLPPGQTRFAGEREIGQAANEAVRREAEAWNREQTEPLQRLKRGVIDTGKIMLQGLKGSALGGIMGPLGVGAGGAASMYRQFQRGREEGSLYERAKAAELAAVEEAGAPEVAFRKAREVAGEAEARRERAEPFREIRELGLQLGGMAETEALRAVQEVLQVGGGGMRGLRQTGMLPTMFAAQTRFGMGADITGAYLQAGRAGRGGLVGAEGRSDEALIGAIQDGMMLGLEGSELRDYMQQMAEGIQSWKTSGIPINQGSIGRLSRSIMDTTTLGGVRATAIGRGLAGAAQAVSETGVQDAIDLMMLQTMGGYRGGGLEEYEKAQMRLEEMGGPEAWGEEQMKDIVTQLTRAGGGGAAGRQVLRKAFARKGIRMSQAETVALERSVTRAPGEAMTPEEEGIRARIQGEAAGVVETMPMGVEDLQAQAADMMKGYGAAVQRAAGIQNLQNTTGERLLTTLQNLQESQALITKGFTNLASGGLNKVSGLVNDFAKSLEGLTSSSDKAAAALDIIGAAAKQF